ncbi:MAG: hypothetical protein EON88_04465 [Brevundimonas sp.]|nr:MAG: hypothetical protein EON88_04465 [Brevundimonas sp.]
MLSALALVAGLTIAPQTVTPPSAPQTLAGLATATPAPDCGGMREDMGDTGSMQCVTAPLGQISDLALTLAAEARSNGWTVAGGGANALWMTKPSTNGRCDRMTIIGFWNFRTYPEPRAGVPGYVGVMVEPDQSCEAPAADTSSPPTAQ